MKKTVIVALLMLCTLDAAFAQQSTKTKKHSHKKSQTTQSQPKTTTKSLDDGTTGTMGKDTVKMSNKGKQRNINANTGVPLPPNSGNGK